MYDLQPYLNTIEDVIAQGPFKDTWESLSAYQVPDWYQNAKIWYFHSLGRLQRSCLWKRMVSASHV